MNDTTPWTFPQLVNRMLSAGWKPTANGGWKHPDGGFTDLSAIMLDKREYWTQLAERHALPPTTPIPENWGKKVTT